MLHYDDNDIFWRDVSQLPENPYRLAHSLEGFISTFVYPITDSDYSKDIYPTPFGYMASLIRMNGGRAEIVLRKLDVPGLDDFHGRDLICFYPMVVSLHDVASFSERIKRDHPDSKICFFNSDQHQHEMLLCNPGSESFARVMMTRYPSIDYVLLGEAEESFIRLAGMLHDGETNFADLPSTLYRENGTVTISKRKMSPVDFTFLPFPARDHLEESLSVDGINSCSPRIQSSRGCLAPCAYCVEASSNIPADGRRTAVLSRDISRFVSEMKLLQDNYGAVFFNVIDSSFEDPGRRGIARMDEFCDVVAAKGVEASIKIHLRAESVTRLEDAFLDKLKRTGVDVVGVGVESGLERELRSFGKIAHVQENIDGVRRLAEGDRFYTILGHMMFTPILEVEELLRKMEFLEDLDYGWDFLSVSNNILVFPGTSYETKLEEWGVKEPCDALDTIISYRFQDPMVGRVADGLNSLKGRFPEILSTHNGIVDSLNVVSRYSNKMNVHLRRNGRAFAEFRSTLADIMESVQETHSSFFRQLVDAVKSDASDRDIDDLQDRHFQGVSSQRSLRTRTNLEGFVGSCEDRGLSTSRLYLHTWMSLINSETNTAGGRIN